MEQLEFLLKIFLGFRNIQEKLENTKYMYSILKRSSEVSLKSAGKSNQKLVNQKLVNQKLCKTINFCFNKERTLVTIRLFYSRMRALIQFG